MQILKTIFKKHSLPKRLVALVLTVVCTVLALSQTVFAKNTYVITDGDQVMVHTTYETDPQAILDEAGLRLSEVDTYVTETVDGMAGIKVRRGMKIYIDSCGEKLQVVSYGETVQELVDRLGIPVLEQSIVSVAMDEQTFDGMEIVIRTTVVSNDSYSVAIPFETVYQQTDLLDAGVEVILTAGVDGQKLCTAEVTYVDGQETSRVVLTEEVISEPVKQVVAVGTGKGASSNEPIIGDGVIITGSGDVLTFTHRETFRATAYCRTDIGGEWTSTGTVTRVGAIAVDPSVIPYGTRMFIRTQDGAYIYGVATAEDCGGAIKGRRLDLFYETNAECIRFGIRDCDVYFLG